MDRDVGKAADLRFCAREPVFAIGFLIAAKSLLRYNDKLPAGEISPSYISKKSEYVLVGTLMSYTCAIAVALLVKMFY